MKQYFIEFLDKYINNQNTIKKQASKINATKDQLILEFEKYIQTLSVDENEINRKELFDNLSKLYNFNKNNAWIWLKEFINNSDNKLF